MAKPEAVTRVATQAQNTPQKASTTTSGSSVTPRVPAQHVVPLTPSNSIYIATSSLDGNVCVASLVDIKDNQLRNFARPVQAVALSPEYKKDRTYLSGGLAGNLVLTVGGRSGTSTTSTTSGSVAAQASGWLGAIGLGSNMGTDRVLHEGEGAITTIKWSLTGRYVVWINEKGFWIMRSNIDLQSADAESAWTTIAHVDPPPDGEWEEMAGVWKGRAEWINEKTLESDEDDNTREKAASTPATAKLMEQKTNSNQRIEKLLVGWGDTVWIINVHPDGLGRGKNAGERSVGRAEKIKM